MAQFLSLPNTTKSDDILFTFTSRAKAWCKEKKLDLHIKQMNLSSLGLEKLRDPVYPELTSRIKESRTRNLLAFVVHFAVEVAAWI